MTAIANLDDWLRVLTAGLVPGPHRFEFRCHPGVFLAIREAADLEPLEVPYGQVIEGSPAFGSADVRVIPGLGPGCWELYENARLLKAGRLDDILPAYVYLHYDTHKHGTSEPGWVQHSHLGGGFPHAHDPETGFQVPIHGGRWPHEFDPATEGDTMAEITGTVTREAQIVYLTEWAARYRCSLQLNGEVGFGRPCVGIVKGDTYIDSDDVKWGGDRFAGDWWEPEDSYRKHDCLAVLDHGDPEAALGQLYAWVRWLDEHGWGVEVVYREPTSTTDLAFHGISTPKLVKLPAA